MAVQKLPIPRPPADPSGLSPAWVEYFNRVFAYLQNLEQRKQDKP